MFPNGQPSTSNVTATPDLLFAELNLCVRLVHFALASILRRTSDHVFPSASKASDQSGQMEGPSLSARPSLPTLPFSHTPQDHFIATRRPTSVRHRSQRARLQPRPRTSASMSLSPVDLNPAPAGTGSRAPRAQSTETTSSTPDLGRPRRPTVQSDIQETIQHPGTVRINVQGAFIVDEEQPDTPQSEDYEHDPKDIRLPNHTTVVSHIAVDATACAQLGLLTTMNFRGVAC
ncbi:predicted protein [Plenodomus lingam JN3]|uniref:Predicted protein n=1 Tax=Leptosphaeria maculans (strain JN3 / isolate v23.1.3 / race Av1-4-5-6-7-8) TaxID=985895 RepID=E4ZHX4_LEPMJ|nr:predicted protein [Plenodomus lingam JN3]CBX91117.1 predicted protein [Plenodomus lingam JN3]